MMIVKIVLCALLGYAVGNIPSGVLIARFFKGPDIRKTGSGNTGTTNVLRTMGWKPSIMTLVLDMLKGVLAALIGKLLGGELGMLIGGFFGILGHDFPAVLGFKGGKGIATTCGATFIICPWVAPCLIVIEFTIVGITKLMSVASLCACVSYPFLFWLLHPVGANMKYTMTFAVVVALLAIFQHRSNIVRLMKGTENALDFSRIARISKERSKKS